MLCYSGGTLILLQKIYKLGMSTGNFFEIVLLLFYSHLGCLPLHELNDSKKAVNIQKQRSSNEVPCSTVAEFSEHDILIGVVFPIWH